jgi:hypothetical protein
MAAAVWTVCLPGATPAAPSAASACVLKLASEPGNGGELQRLKAAIPNVVDQEERGRFCLIYYLGSLLYVHSIEAEAVERYVQTRLAGSVAAQALQEDCLAPCAKCQTGTVLQPCRDCTGSGICVSCKGTGASVARGFDGKPMRCAACSGTRQCRSCAGAGGTRKKCETCGGRGSTRDEARAKTWYALLLQTNVVVRMPAPAAPAPPPPIMRPPSLSRPFGFTVATRDPPGKNPFCQTVVPDMEARRALLLALASGKNPQEVLRGASDVVLPFVAPWDEVVPVFDARATMLQREEIMASRAAKLWPASLRIPGGIGYVFVKLRDGVEFRVKEVKPLTASDGNDVVVTVEAPDGVTYSIYAPRESRAPVVSARRGEAFRSASWCLVFEVTDGEINLWGNEIAVNKDDLIRRVLQPPRRQVFIGMGAM